MAQNSVKINVVVMAIDLKIMHPSSQSAENAQNKKESGNVCNVIT